VHDLKRYSVSCSILTEGNLTRDPESRITSTGSKVVSFDIASNRYYRKDDQQVEEVMYIRMEAWGRTADVCEQYLKKGGWVRAVGRLKQDRWVSEDGQPKDRHVIVVEHIEFRNKQTAAQEAAV
jgi:single-strand DNA-binding protein